MKSSGLKYYISNIIKKSRLIPSDEMLKSSYYIKSNAASLKVEIRSFIQLPPVAGREKSSDVVKNRISKENSDQQFPYAF